MAPVVMCLNLATTALLCLSKAHCQNFSCSGRGDLILGLGCVLGDLLETGKKSAELNDFCANLMCKCVVLIGRSVPDVGKKNQKKEKSTLATEDRKINQWKTVFYKKPEEWVHFIPTIYSFQTSSVAPV